ncbi:MAG: TetR/AcrR family transcriptional regulator [Acidimicrobiales bacterium]|nr:TetR/AcrR family transcriptional regulator [Acidimicrobiales bacterium]
MTTTDAASTASADSTASGRRPANRRDLILYAAIDLFHQRGYPATSVDDIGKAVDVSGPAIYRHFSSKEDLLLEAIKLAADEVHAINGRARAEASDARELLAGYIRAYVDVALERSALIAVWNSEARHLSSERRSPMSRRLRSWSTEWIEALQDARPELDEPTARLLVNGAIGMITSITTGPAATEVEGLTDSITSMALATLDAPVA